jgi:hypothetical protein
VGKGGGEVGRRRRLVRMMRRMERRRLHGRGAQRKGRVGFRSGGAAAVDTNQVRGRGLELGKVLFSLVSVTAVALHRSALPLGVRALSGRMWQRIGW